MKSSPILIEQASRALTGNYGFSPLAQLLAAGGEFGIEVNGFVPPGI